ncbi:MAG: CDP-archaeol synthase [Waddliaceae bacterium]
MMVGHIGHLGQRILVSLIGFTVFFFALFTSSSPILGWLLPLFCMCVFGAAMKEFCSIARRKGFDPPAYLGIGISTAYIIAIIATAQTPGVNLLPLSCLIIALLLIFFFYFFKKKDSFINLSIALFGIGYLVIPLGSGLQMTYFFPDGSPQDGRWWVAYLIAISYITDGSALFVGKTLGRNKLAPSISPQKTWEGAIGGLIAAILASVLFYFFAHRRLIPMAITLGESIFLGSVISCLAQFGDLAESLLKRDAGIKDSATIPGLGGVLDIVDSLIFTSPFLYLFLAVYD